jgi:triacylglycerol lipase
MVPTVSDVPTAPTMPALRAPVVFVHGLLGFDYLRLGKWRLACYWSSLPESVRAAGNRVLVARVPALGTVCERARQLKAFLDERCPNEPVHLFAHSMGGLDCRYMISRLGMASRVLSLTTIATPHRGTPFADWGLRRVLPVLQPFFAMFGCAPRAIEDLTTAACARFNEEVPDAPGVRYYSVAGHFDLSWFSPFVWRVSWNVIRKEQGPNDGLVPVSSATYGEHVSLWEGDHVSLINFLGRISRAGQGWPDRTPAYAALLTRLVTVEA